MMAKARPGKRLLRMHHSRNVFLAEPLMDISIIVIMHISGQPGKAAPSDGPKAPDGTLGALGQERHAGYNNF